MAFFSGERCPGVNINRTNAGAEVAGAIDFAQATASSAILGAEAAASELLSFTFAPVTVPLLDIDSVTYPGYQAPERPAADISTITVAGEPVRGALSDVDLSGLNRSAPVYDLATPNIEVPASPALTAPLKPGAAPTFDSVEMPTYTAGALPSVPTLEELQIPEAPTLDLDSFDVTRPEFDLPYEHIYENNLITDTGQLATSYLNDYLAFDSDSVAVRDRWATMLQGGTGLPAAIEQALFDRGIGREEMSSEQAIRQAQGEWAARGFSLPGSTLLAREGEIRRANRTERGRINRELTIQLHEKEIENLRFTVEQGVRLEGQRFEAYVRVTDAARSVVSNSYEVARQLLSARIEVLNAHLQIYQTDVQALRERVQIELTRLEVFRTQLEAERVRGEINQQRVDIYEVQLRAVLANVDIYKAQIEGANGLVRAQIGEMELYKGRIDAYTAEWQGQKIQYDAYATKVGAEEVKSRIFNSQVSAYGERVRAFGTEMDAQGTKVGAQNAYNESVTEQYRANVDAWQSKVSAQVEQVRTQVAEFQAEIQRYSVDVQGEQVRSDGFRSNAALTIERSRADVEAKLKAVDQQIQQLQLAETLGSESLRAASQSYSQLAASALSAVNASASVSNSMTQSLGATSSCSESYVLSGEIPS